VAPKRRKQKVREAKHALYRELVLAAAERVFAEKGYDDSKMEEVARESGIALGTLYSVFSGKAEIFHAIHAEADRALLQRSLEAARGVEDPLAAVLAGVRAYTGYFLEHPDLLRMHLREGLTWGDERSGAGSRSRTDAWRAGVAMLTTAVERCIAAGRFVAGDARMIARMMIAMQQVQLADWIESDLGRDPAEVMNAIVAQVERSFAVRRKP
jgi:AcrR family transcriptional regulator